MAGISLSQAAKASGRSKSTIGRAIKDGRLSAIRNADDTFSIEPSELFRVFARGGPGTDRDGSIEPSQNPPLGTVGTGVEAGEIKALRDELSKAQQRASAAEAKAEERAETIADLRDRLNQEGEERRKLTAILTDQKAPAAPEAVKPSRSLWQRIFN